MIRRLLPIPPHRRRHAGMDCPNTKRRNAVAGLPEDLLVDILARVPTKSLYRSKCVAKAWRDLIEDPLHRKRLPQTLHGFFFVDEKIHGRRPIDFVSLTRRSVHLQIDLSLSFLKKLPGIETLAFSDSCNGLLLFENKQKSRPFDLLGYVVCNPATEQGVVVPRHSPLPPVRVREAATRSNYLVFDPSVSSHFHLVHFGWEYKESMEFEDEFVDYDDELNDGYVHDYWGHHQQHYNEDNDDLVDLVDDVDRDVDNDIEDQHYIDDGNDDDDLVDVDNDIEEQHYIDDANSAVDFVDDDVNDEVEDSDDDDAVNAVHYVDIAEEVYRTSVHVYSSVTGKWTRMQSDWGGEHNLVRWRYQGLVPCQRSWCAVLNGMLHFVSDQNHIAAVDVQGVTKKIIPLPAMPEKKSWPEPGYVAQSQGRLHYINKKYDDGLFIWVLEDYDAQAWVLKHSVTFKELFGKNNRTCSRNDYTVVAMHPDGNVVFIVQGWNLKLVSYQMDSKLVSVIGTLDNQMDRKLVSVIGTLSDNDQMAQKLLNTIGNLEDNTSTIHVVAYVPCFSESLVLTNKH